MNEAALKTMGVKATQHPILIIEQFHPSLAHWRIRSSPSIPPSSGHDAPAQVEGGRKNTYKLPTSTTAVLGASAVGITKKLTNLKV
jgi:hypothetical protein